MPIHFSEKFKQLRKDKDLTQEQIADIFHVSPQAVSRWETGTNYPDIETLLQLSSFFDVTVDELLEADKVAKEAEAKEYSREIWSLSHLGKVDEAIKVARKAINDHPINAELHELLVHLLSMVEADDPESMNEHKDEIIALSIRMINTVDYQSSLPNRVQLIQNYIRWGMKEEAKKLINTLPTSMRYTKLPYLDLVLESREEWDQAEIQINAISETGNVSFMYEAMQLLLLSIDQFLEKNDLSAMQKIEKYKTKQQIRLLLSTILWGTENNEGNEVQIANDNREIASLYCEIGDKENALDYIEKAVQSTIKHDEHMAAQEDIYIIGATTRNLAWILWEDRLAKPCFDYIRNEERFKSCIETLKSNSCDSRELK